MILRFARIITGLPRRFAARNDDHPSAAAGWFALRANKLKILYDL